MNCIMRGVCKMDPRRNGNDNECHWWLSIQFPVQEFDLESKNWSVETKKRVTYIVTYILVTNIIY